MSLRMVSLWIVGALLVAATLKADPPQVEPAEIANRVKDGPVMPKPVPVASADKRQIQFDVKVWDVDHATLRAITKTDMGVHEFYKANGLIRLSEWISAAFDEAVGELLSPPSRKGATPATLPTRAFAVRNSSVSTTLLDRDISSAFKTFAEPTLVTLNGAEAALLCGGEVPIFVPRDGSSKQNAFLEFGLKMKFLPRLMGKDRVVLGLDFENSEVDPKSEAGEAGIKLISSQGFRLSAQMKLGEQLLVAQQMGKQDVTRLVQIQPTLPTEQAEVEKSLVPKTVVADRNPAEQFVGQLDVPAPAKPVEVVTVGGQTDAKRSAPPNPFRTHNRILGEESDVAKSVLFEVKVYEIDHSQLPSGSNSEKRQAAFDDLLRPWLDGWRGSKLEKGNVTAWATKRAVSASEVEKRNESVRLVSEPKLMVLDGEIGSFDYGGKTPQIEIQEQNQATSRTTPLAGTFALESAVAESGRVFVSVFFDKHGSPRKKRSTVEELKQDGVKVNSELSVGQTLCLSDARFNSNQTNDSLLVTITPVEIQTLEREQRIRAVAAKPAKPNQLEITVEDRWPAGTIAVGQRVVAIPVSIEKSSLVADMVLMQLMYEGESALPKVTRIERLAESKGRRVTLAMSLPRTNTDLTENRRADFLARFETAVTTIVVPASSLSQADLYDARMLREVYQQIPLAQRPQPVELVVGDTFMLGFIGSFGEPANGHLVEHGPLLLEHIDDGYWRVTAKKVGVTHLVQVLPTSADIVGTTRLTEYYVKSDTRELELHIRQQFPSAKVTITSIGAAAVMLKGTVSSDEDATGIVELAEQFAPKVLNRLKVDAAIGSRTRESSDRSLTTSATEPRAVRQANGIADDDDLKSTGERGPPQRTPLAESNVTEPQRVRPLKSGRGNSPKSEQLQQLRDEIRKLRQDVRELIQRLDLEPATTLKNNDDAKLIIKTYSVAQLVVPSQPMHMQFRVDDNKAKLVGLDKPVPPANSLTQLLEMIKSTIAPDSWEEAGDNGLITANDSTLSLVVRQTRAVHDELRSLLEALQKLSDQQVSLEFRVIKTDENFHGFGFDLPFAWTQLKPNEAKVLNSKEADALIAAAKQERRTSLFSLPKLTLMTGQPMTLDVTSGSLPAPLHLSGFAMPLAADGHGFTRLHLSARGTDEQSAAHNLSTVCDGHSLLINLTNVFQSGTHEGVPILNKVPHVDRLFKSVSATKSLKPGEQLFLLATPRLIPPEAEEELLLGVPD